MDQIAIAIIIILTSFMLGAYITAKTIYTELVKTILSLLDFLLHFLYSRVSLVASRRFSENSLQRSRDAEEGDNDE